MERDILVARIAFVPGLWDVLERDADSPRVIDFPERIVQMGSYTLLGLVS